MSYISFIIFVIINGSGCFSQTSPCPTPATGNMYDCARISNLIQDLDGNDFNGVWIKYSEVECYDGVYIYQLCDGTLPNIYLCHGLTNNQWTVSDTICDQTDAHRKAYCWRAKHDITSCNDETEWNVQTSSGVYEIGVQSMSLQVLNQTQCNMAISVSPTNNPTNPTNIPSFIPSNNPTISESTVSGTNTQKTTDDEEAVVETTTVTDGMVTSNNGEKELNNNLINDYIVYTVIAAVASITLLNCCIFILCCYLKKRNKDKGENAATNMNQIERVGSVSTVNMITNSNPPQTPQTPETSDMLLAGMSTAGNNIIQVDINAENDPQQIIHSMNNNNNNISTMVLLSDPLPADDDGDDDDIYLKPNIETNDGGTIGND